jgi:hypothetical protein
MIGINGYLNEQAAIITGLAPITPSTSTPDYVSMKGFSKLTIVILADNATTVTGSAITVKQATDVANSASDEKAVAFTKVWQNIDTGAGAALTETAVVSNTFTTTTVDAKNSIYVIEIDENDLDVAGGFDCVRAGTANATSAVLSVLYILWPAKYAGAAINPTVD